MKILYKIYARLFARETFRKLKYAENIPNNPLHDDIYIVEFPKSGITWLSFILANVDMLMSDTGTNITYFNIHKFIPDVHQLRGADIGNEKLEFLDRRLIKSHASYNPYYYSVIYLLRNPFNVMKSFYRFRKNYGYSGSFGQFIRLDKFGIDAWVSHVESWLYQHENSPQLLFVLKYEDLKKQKISKLQDLYKNFGLKVDKNIFEEVFNITDIKNMRKTEQLYRKHNPRHRMKFVGEGSISAVEDMDVNSRRYIQTHAQKILKDYYPELLKSI